MNIFKALEFFCIYSGLDKNEASKVVPLIASTASSLERRLKDAAFAPTDEVAEVVAALTFYRYVLTEEASFGGVFSAGSVKMDSTKRSSLAYENYKSVYSMHSHLFIDDEPVFFGVAYETNC